MKVLSIREPWASLIINGYKKYEFRSWKTNYRGDILIHVSKSMDKEIINKFKSYNLSYKPGYIIGKAKITDCIKVDNDFEEKLIKKDKNVYGLTKGRFGYAFKLEDVEIFDEPIKINGKLGLWNYE